MNAIARVGAFSVGISCLLLSTPKWALAVPRDDSNQFRHWKPDPPNYWSQQQIFFEMRGKSWPVVLQWFAEQAGLELITPTPTPKTTFTFINPTINGVPKMYKLVDVFDILNEILQGHTKHTLVCGPTTLTLVAADQPVETWPRIPRVALRDLACYGRTEVVEVMGKWHSNKMPRQGYWSTGFDGVRELDAGYVVMRCNVGHLADMMRRGKIADAR